MLNLSLAEIVEIVSGRLVSAAPGVESLRVQNAVSDSRAVKPGLLFVALRGERHDGHDYLETARQEGAVAALVEKETIEILPQIVVGNCRAALAALAKFQLRRYPVKIVAVTGSMGKTSCKDLIAGVLSMRYKVLKNAGNMNTEVTLPITLFGLEAEHQIAVLEMGMIAAGEIRELCTIAPPDFAIISNIHEVHLERLGSIEAIATTKGEIFEALSATSIGLVNADDPRVVEQAQRIKGHAITYGIAASAEMSACEIQSLGREGSRYTLVFPDGRQRRVTLPLPGEHMVHNSLPAALIGFLLELTPEEIAAGLEAMRPSGQRLNILELTKERLLIDDSYNANPYSVAAALSLVAELREERPVWLVLGDMLELGEVSEEAHRRVGCLVADLKPDRLIVRGALSPEIAAEAVRRGFEEQRIFRTASNLEALEILRVGVPQHALILVKGSRGLQMEEIVKGLEAM